MNHFVNFLFNLCDQDDLMSSSRILNSCQLFQFGYSSWVEFSDIRAEQYLRSSELDAASHFFNVFTIQETMLKRYMESYDIQKNYIQKDMFRMLIETDQALVMSQFHDVIHADSITLTKDTIARLDELFEVFETSQPQLEEEEKTEFKNAKKKVTRKFGQDMRIFREFLMSETNKQLTDTNQSAMKQQENKLLQSLTSMRMLVHTSYIKKIQMRDELLHKIEMSMKPIEPAIVQRTTLFGQGIQI